MHVVIGGYGRVGRYLAHELESQGHTVAVVDRNAAVFNEFDSINGRRLAGEVFDRDTLIKAGIERADAFAAVTSGDNSNIVSARAARERFGVKTVVARIFDPRRAAIYARLGIPTVSSVQWSAAQLLSLLVSTGVETQTAVGPQGDVVIADVIAPEHVVGKRVLDIELPRVMHIVAVERQGVGRMLADLDVIEEGDLLFVSVVRESLHELTDLLSREQGA